MHMHMHMHMHIEAALLLLRYERREDVPSSLVPQTWKQQGCLYVYVYGGGRRLAHAHMRKHADQSGDIRSSLVRDMCKHIPCNKQAHNTHTTRTQHAHNTHTRPGLFHGLLTLCPPALGQLAALTHTRHLARKLGAPDGQNAGGTHTPNPSPCPLTRRAHDLRGGAVARNARNA